MGTGINFASVNLEDLNRDPAGKLKQICDYIKMPYRAGQERFWEGEYDHLFGSLGTRKQVEVGEGEFRQVQTYEPAFDAVSRAVEQMVESNAILRRVVDWLDSIELAPSCSRPIEKPVGPIRYYPLWYYGYKGRIIARRWLPRSLWVKDQANGQ